MNAFESPSIGLVVLTIFAHATLISTVALVVASTARRHPPLRKWILSWGLIGVLFAPVVFAAFTVTGTGLSLASGELFEPLEQLGYQAEPPIRSTEEQRWASRERAQLSNPVEASTAQYSSKHPSSKARNRLLTASSMLDWMLMIWSAGVLVSVTGIVRSWWKLRSIVATATVMPAERFNSVIEGVEARPARRFPTVAVSVFVEAPVTAGLFHSRVLLPADYETRYTREELRAILLHEFAHADGFDQFLLLLQNVAAALYWPHPLVHLLNRRLGQAREEVCDNHALSAMERPAYCELLLRIASSVGRPCGSSSFAMGFLTQNWKLEQRIRGILNKRRTTMTRTNKWIMAGAATVFAAMTILAGSTRLTNAVSEARRVSTAGTDARFEPVILIGPHGKIVSTEGDNVTIRAAVAKSLGKRPAIEEVPPTDGVDGEATKPEPNQTQTRRVIQPATAVSLSPVEVAGDQRISEGATKQAVAQAELGRLSEEDIEVLWKCAAGRKSGLGSMQMNSNRLPPRTWLTKQIDAKNILVLLLPDQGVTPTAYLLVSAESGQITKRKATSEQLQELIDTFKVNFNSATATIERKWKFERVPTASGLLFWRTTPLVP